MFYPEANASGFRRDFRLTPRGVNKVTANSISDNKLQHLAPRTLGEGVQQKIQRIERNTLCSVLLHFTYPGEVTTTTSLRTRNLARVSASRRPCALAFREPTMDTRRAGGRTVPGGSASPDARCAPSAFPAMTASPILDFLYLRTENLTIRYKKVGRRTSWWFVGMRSQKEITVAQWKFYVCPGSPSREQECPCTCRV